MKGFILAAGLGTRLQPITHHWPKPLVPLCNRPLIGWAVETFLAAGIDDLIVNLHHLPEPLEQYLSEAYAGRARFFFSREEGQILGTGGGIRRVREQLRNEEEFFLVNGDTVQFPRWEALRNARREHDALAALTLRHPPEGDKFTAVYSENGLITGFGTGTGEALMFAGSHVISTRILDVLPDREVSGIVEHAYIPSLQQERLAGVVDDGLWYDVGTPDRYRGAARGILGAILRGEVPAPEDSQATGDSLMHETARGRAIRSTVGARSVIEGEVRDSFIWDDCHIAAGVTVENCIVAHGAILLEGEYRDAVIVAPSP